MESPTPNSSDHERIVNLQYRVTTLEKWQDRFDQQRERSRDQLIKGLLAIAFFSLPILYAILKGAGL